MNDTALRAKVLVQQQQNQINSQPFLAVQNNFTNIRMNDRCCAKLKNMILLLAVKSSFFTTFIQEGGNWNNLDSEHLWWHILVFLSTCTNWIKRTSKRNSLNHILKEAKGTQKEFISSAPNERKKTFSTLTWEGAKPDPWHKQRAL